MDAHRIFISRTGADRDTAIWVQQTLTAAGYACVLQDRDFKIGESFPRHMREAFENCGATLALMSPEYWASEFCLDEWDAAYALDRGGQGRLIPVMARPCAVPRLAAKLAYFDQVRLPESVDRATALVQAVDLVLKQGADLPDALAPDPARISNDAFHTDFFTGRDDELAALHAALWGGAEAAAITPPAAVTGLGGVGKSAIAKEYARRHFGRYSGAWMVRAETEATRDADLAALGAQLDARLRDATDIAAAARAGADLARRLAVQQGRPFLILLDNVETPQGVPDWLRVEGLHIIASSRFSSESWPAWAKPVEVEKLPPEAARALLLETSKRAPGAGLEALLDALDGLPLALVQAGAFLRERRSQSFQDYVDALAARLAKAPRAWDSDQKLVAATYERSIEEAEREAPGATALLTQAAFFAPDEIPITLLSDAPEDTATRDAADMLALFSLWRRGATEAGSPGSRVAAGAPPGMTGGEGGQNAPAAPDGAAALVAPDDASSVAAPDGASSVVAPDSASSPVTPDGAADPGPSPDHMVPHGPTVSLHRLLQTVLRAELAPETLADTAQACARRLRARFEGDPGDVRTWPVNAPLAPHALALSSATPEEAARPDLALALNEAGTFFYARAEHGPAEAVMRRALTIDEVSHGPDHPTVAIRLNNLAALLRATNRPAEAEPLSRRALAIDEASLGPDHPTVG
ncbi:MAG: toll/interleukin-1 receptor domain-containing protein, partial [Pseudomonadota bacterium]